MSIYKKTLLIIAVTTIVLTIVLSYVIDRVTADNYRASEIKFMHSDTQRAINHITNTAEAFGEKWYDYSAWDDTYKFIEKRDKAYIDANFSNEWLFNLKVNLLVILDSTGEVAFSTLFDGAKKERAAVPDGFVKALLPFCRFEKNDDGRQGFVRLGGAVYMVSIRPVTTTDIRAKSNGVFIAGRIFDESAVSPVSKELMLPIFMADLGSKALTGSDRIIASRIIAEKQIMIEDPAGEPGEHKIAGYCIFNDLAGSPLLFLKIVRDEINFVNFKVASDFLRAAIVITSLIFGLVILFFLRFNIVSRIGSMSSDIKKLSARRNLADRITVPGRDEISEIGMKINELLETLQKMDKTVNDYKNYLEMLVQKKSIDLVEKESQLSTMINSIPETAWIKDRAGIIRLVNEQYARLAGMEASDIIGKTETQLWPGGFIEFGRAGDDEEIIRSLASRTEVFEKASGGGDEKKWIEVFKTPLIARTGEIIGVIGISRDITEYKKAQEVLRNANAELEKLAAERTRKLESAMVQAESANRIKSEFLANMSHEIRTPLNSIIGFSDMIAKTAMTQEQSEMIEPVRLAGRALMALINDILDFSKIEADRLELECVEFDLNRIAGEVISLMNPMAVKKELELVAESGAPLENLVKGDPGRLRQILLNLVSNAIKFTGKGKVVVKLAVAGSGPGTVRARFDVTDDGIGIADDVKPMLFKPFTQADRSTTRKFGGTGLGLAISDKLARMMGAERIFLESAPGRGSRFYFTVEFSLGRNIAGKEQAPKPAAQRRSRSYRILLAEDSATNQFLATKLLKMFGHEVMTADNGQMALDMIAKEKFDVVLMDMEMPIMDGVEATTRMRAMGVTLPVIALTASAMKGDEAICRKAGMNAYITKPINIETLEPAIAGVIESAEAPEPKPESKNK